MQHFKQREDKQMKMYKTADIIESLVTAWENNLRYVGFHIDKNGIITMTFKEHQPDWKDDRTGSAESTETLTIWENSGEYRPL